MRILHLAPQYAPERGPIAAHVGTLAERQARFAAVTVLAPDDGGSVSLEVRNGVQVVQLAPLFAVRGVRVCPGLNADIRRFAPDLVHLHCPHPYGAYAYLTSRVGAPLVVTLHEGERHSVTGTASRILSRASAILIPAERSMEFSARLEPYREQCRAIPFGIEPAPAPEEAVERLRQRYGENWVLAAGDLARESGFELLIRAMCNVDSHLVILGTGPTRMRLVDLIADLGLAQRVHLDGEVEQVGPYFAACSIFVAPGATRTRDTSLELQAMARGKPVVNSDIEAPSVHGKTGLTVPAGDARALSSALRVLLKSESLRREYGTAAEARAHRHFNVDAMTERTLAVYGEVLGTAAPTRTRAAAASQ